MTAASEPTEPSTQQSHGSDQDGYVEDTSADGVVRLTWHPSTPDQQAAARDGGDA